MGSRAPYRIPSCSRLQSRTTCVAAPRLPILTIPDGFALRLRSQEIVYLAEKLFLGHHRHVTSKARVFTFVFPSDRFVLCIHRSSARLTYAIQQEIENHAATPLALYS
jgi:hypothetical protein